MNNALLSDVGVSSEEERTSLLVNANGLDVASPDGTATYLDETWVFIRYMLPIFANQLIIKYCTILGPVTAMGKHGSLALAGGALATSTLVVLALVPALAATSALDTLSTQAHGGSASNLSKKNLNRLYALRVYLITWLLFVIFLPMICLSGPVFILCKIDHQVAHIAGRYMQIAAWGVPALFAYECMRKYCQAQGRMTGPALAVALASIPTIGLLSTQTFGLYTPAVALACFWNGMAFILLAYVQFVLPSTSSDPIPAFSVVKQDLAPIMKLTLAGFIGIGSEIFAWEYLNFVAAWMGNDALAANSVFLSTAHFFCALPNGLSYSSSTVVGNYLGSNQPRNAKKAAHTSLMLGVVVSAIPATVVLIKSRSWADLFTSDPNVLGLVHQIMPFFCFILCLDAVQGICVGILRGAGLPIAIARAMVFNHYCIGLPLATIFGFPMNGGIFGLWLGLGVGLLCLCWRLTFLILWNDWTESAGKAQAHLKASERSFYTPLQDPV